MYLASSILFEKSSFLLLTSLSSSGKWRLFHILPHFLNRDKWAARCCGRAIDLDRFWSLLDLDGFRSIFYSSVLILMGIWAICKICIQTKQFWVDYIVLSVEVYAHKILIAHTLSEIYSLSISQILSDIPNCLLWHKKEDLRSDMFISDRIRGQLKTYWAHHMFFRTTAHNDK